MWPSPRRDSPQYLASVERGGNGDSLQDATFPWPKFARYRNPSPNLAPSVPTPASWSRIASSIPLPDDLLDAFEGRASPPAEPASQQGASPFEQSKRQWAGKLRAFYDQKHRSPRHEDPLKLTDVIARLQAPQSADRESLLASAEKFLLAATGRRAR